jgi:hypothetical protein
MAVPASAPTPMLNDTRKSMPAGPRSEEVGFAHDSALEGTRFEPSVPRAGGSPGIEGGRLWRLAQSASRGHRA